MKYFSFLVCVFFLTACSSSSNILESETVPTVIPQHISTIEKEIEREEKSNTELQSESLSITPEQIDQYTQEYTGEYYLPIFMFHYIENISENTPDQIRYTLSFSPEKLESFLQYFQEQEIQTLTFYDIAEFIKNNEPLPENSVILTFDDGHNDHYTDAFRLLEKYNMKGVFYVISEKPNNDSEYMTWDEIREIANAGHEIGSHTKTHRDLRTLNTQEKEDEIIGSKNRIEKELKNTISQKIISFCYPAGKYDADDLTFLSDNFLFARTTQNGKSLQFAGDKKYLLPTVRLFPTTGIASLRYWFQ